MTVSGIAMSLLSHGFLDTMLVAMLPISIVGSLSLDESSDIYQESLQVSLICSLALLLLIRFA